MSLKKIKTKSLESSFEKAERPNNETVEDSETAKKKVAFERKYQVLLKSQQVIYILQAQFVLC